MKVLKFGGSSVATAERIKGVVDILKSYYVQGTHFTVVFSALGGTTDWLLDMGGLAASGNEDYLVKFDHFRQRHIATIDELFHSDYRSQVTEEVERNADSLRNLLQGIYLLKEASPKTMDLVLSFGERNATFIVTHALRQMGVNASFLDARRIIVTDSHFGSAAVAFETTYANIRRHYDEHPEIQVVTGFIGSTEDGLTTTLGRGGSDYTAAIIAAGLQASLVEIWTDVNGVLTADPRLVKKAFTIPAMTYAEAMEMSHFGAKVIYPPTLQPVLRAHIPMAIRNTFNPSFLGTYISDQTDPGEHAVKGISSIAKISLLTLSGGGMFGVPGTAARLFGSLAQSSINVILITQGSSEYAISFAIQPAMAQKARLAVEQEFKYELAAGLIDPVKVEEELAVVAIIGENMRYRPGIAGRLFQALGKNGINVVAIAQGSSELNISVVIARQDESKALNALHDAFFLSDTVELHLFMVGTGLIGSALLQQIAKQADYLRDKHDLEIKLVGLANSRRMLINQEGISLQDDWSGRLMEEGEPTTLAAFVHRMKSLNLPNAIFVDNTADPKVAAYYEAILDASISISTPNKIATSSFYLQYQRLKTIANRRGVLFLYETNVGAGLPVITTLNDLINSGDEIISIEGVLSGSLSFILNSFTEGSRFSEIVREAKRRGFTEPDPREDLSGADVRRKLLILARETGLPMESSAIEIEPILPAACLQAKDVETFFETLVAADTYFEDLRQKAAAAGKVLRMVARLSAGRASIGLQEVGPESPFYYLSGSDNMIVFVTGRYSDRPLVVRGPGAGAEVTAAGIFAEIIKIGNFLS
jgi:aspartokinase/homoserine dehydrogenase 1